MDIIKVNCGYSKIGRLNQKCGLLNFERVIIIFMICVNVLEKYYGKILVVNQTFIKGGNN